MAQALLNKLRQDAPSSSAGANGDDDGRQHYSHSAYDDDEVRRRFHASKSQPSFEKENGFVAFSV